MKRERETVTCMISLYCHHKHGSAHGVMCPQCAELHEYAMKRLSACPFQAGKTTCGKCKVHCYRPDMRERIREVMKFSGPRMMWRHPYLAFMHFLDGFRKEAYRPD